MSTETIVRQTTRTGTDILTELPHVCPRCQRESAWFRNQNGSSFCVRCALRETAEHDPAECDIEACEQCREFGVDETQDRAYRSRHGE